VQIFDKSVIVSAIFKWYASDFGKESKNIVAFISQYLEESDAKKIKSVAAAHDNFLLKYADYDWSPNSSM